MGKQYWSPGYVISPEPAGRSTALAAGPVMNGRFWCGSFCGDGLGFTTMSGGQDTSGAWLPPQQQPMVSTSGGGSGGTIQFPIVVRYSRTGEYLLITVGALWMIGALFYSRGPRTVVLIGGIVLAVAVVMWGSGQDFVVIQPDEVIVNSRIGTTVRTVSIDGIQDLQLSGRRLLRRSDGKVIAKVISAGTNRFDTDAVVALLDRVAPASGAGSH